MKLSPAAHSMTLFYYDPLFREHRTGNHPECAERLAAVMRHLEREQLDVRCQRPRWELATVEQLSRVHSPVYVKEVQQFADAGGGWMESDTFVSPRSSDVALLATGAVCDAVRQVVTGEERRAFCLVRPPGHHALSSSAMGFCLFNSVAVGARLATSELELDRVLIVDWDVHHGNGTQDTFWEDEQVGFFSIHRWPFYPGTGASYETGSGSGLGATMNLPIEFGMQRSDYLQLFASRLEYFARKMQPQLVILSAGFDSHREDPIGSLGLETEDFIELTRSVLEVADQYTGGRVVSVLEGGYHPEVLGDCVAVHLSGLLSRDQNR